MNVTRRGSVYYFKKLVNGKRLFQSLDTSDKQIAVARAKSLAAKAAGEKWQEIDGLKVRRDIGTIGAVKALFRPAALARGIKETTIYGYCQQLDNLVRKVRGEIDVDKASTAILTEDLIVAYERQAVSAAADPLARERAQRTVRSTVVCARSIFAKWTKREYKTLNLPESLKGFKEASLGRAPVKSYRIPPGDLIAKTLEEGRRLRETNPPLYLVFLLTYDLGLRAGEARACKWEWFAPPAPPHRAERCVEILRRVDFTPKWNKERRVPVSEELWGHLTEAWWRRPHLGLEMKGFVFPGETETERYDLVNREFAAWMRSIGWDRAIYPKCAHELRKLMGSRWYTECGAEVAQELLGHETVATTCSFYAALRRQPKALGLEFRG